jgi:glycerate 2-kinase
MQTSHRSSVSGGGFADNCNCTSQALADSGGTDAGFARGAARCGVPAGAVIALRGEPGVYGLAGDTDGVDGQEEIAGGYFSPCTLGRAFNKGLEPMESLDRADADQRERLPRDPG